MSGSSSRILFSAVVATGLIVLESLVRPATAESVDPRFWGTDGQVNAVVVAGDAVYIGGSFSRVAPVTGGGVPLSADTGAPLPSFPEVNGYVYAAVPDRSGGWFLGGSFTHVGGVPRDNLAHLLADGTLSDWNPGVHDSYGGSNGYVFALALKGTTLYVGGFFTMIGPTRRGDLAAVDAVTGELDPWAPEPIGYVSALLVEGNTLYVGGPFNRISGQPRANIAAFDVATRTLSPWNPRANGPVRALAAVGEVVYAGGEFMRMGGLGRGHLAALDARTGTVLAWDPSPDGDVHALVATRAAVYAGGHFHSIGGQTRHEIAALDPSSGLATTWTTSAAFGGVDGLALVEGTLYAIGGEAVAALDAVVGAVYWHTRLNRRGAVVAPASDFAEIKARPSRKHRDSRRGRRRSVYVGGDFTSVGEGVPRACLAAFDHRTGAVKEWSPRANGPVNALAVTGGSVWIGGHFSTINDEPHRGLAAVDPRTGESSGIGLDTDGDVLALAARAGTVYVGGHFTLVGGAARSNLAAIDAHGGEMMAWNPGANDAVRSLALDGSRLYAGGSFTLAGGGGSGSVPRRRAAAFDARNGKILPWDPDANGAVMAILPGADRIYLGGGFSQVGDAGRYGLAAVDPWTGALESWNPGMTNFDDHPGAAALAVKGRTLYVGGRFQFLGGHYWRYHFGAVDAVTGVATPWDPQLRGTALALARRGNMLCVGGAFNTVGGYPCDNFAVIRLRDDSRETSEAIASSAIEAGGTWSLSLECAPNPSRAGTVLRFTLPSAASVTLTVYDVAGRRVRTLLRSESLAAGMHEMPLETGSWRPGVYLSRIEAGGRTLVRKLLVSR